MTDRTPAGSRYGSLVVIGPSAPNTAGSRPRATLILRCDCGNRIIRIKDEVARGRVRSCGCVKKGESDG